MSKNVIAGFEILESRRLFAMGAGADPVNYIGATDGVHAAAVVPTVTGFNSPENPASTDRDAGISVNLALVAGAIKASSLSRAQFQIFEVGNPTPITTGNVQTSGGGDTLSVQPSVPLKANTQYRVEINSNPDGAKPKIRDISENIVEPATLFFTTNNVLHTGDPYIKFNQSNTGVTSRPYSATTIGPDGRLYAGTLEGRIYSWAIGSNGALSDEKVITTIQDNNKSVDYPNGYRFITGITFDPRAPASNPLLWVSHGQYAFGGSQAGYADNFTGKISRLRGANFRTYQDVIVGIPRSVKDHLNNQIVFNPEKSHLFFLIPSMNAMGAADTTWGNRAENVFSAALMRLDVTKIEPWLAANGPIDLTCNSSGVALHYNAFKGANPLRYYATGIRNAYDMAFVNGHLYMSTNGSSAGGNAPAVPGSLVQIPSTNRLDYATGGAYSGQLGVSGINGVNQTEPDVLLNIKPGKYYGHPNPTRGEYILNGGNPTPGAGNDPMEIAQYPAGTLPDRNYELPAAILGDGMSPNGMQLYNSNAFGGLLNGYILIARYNTGQDIIAVKPNADGSLNIDSSRHLVDNSQYLRGTIGFTGLTLPLDLVHNPVNGNIYVAGLTDSNTAVAKGQITLLKPALSNPNAVMDRTRIVNYAPPGDMNGATKSFTITNNGDTGLLIDASATRATGAGKRSFLVTNFPTKDISLRPGQSFTFVVKFVAAAGQSATSYANLAIATNDPDSPYTVVQLRGVPQGATPSSVSRTAQAVAAGPASIAAGPATHSRIGEGLFGDSEISSDDLGLLV